MIESSGSAPMASLPELNFPCITEDHFKEDFDEDVIYAIMHIDCSCEASLKSKALNKEGNKLLSTKEYMRALNRGNKEHHMIHAF